MLSVRFARHRSSSIGVFDNWGRDNWGRGKIYIYFVPFNLDGINERKSGLSHRLTLRQQH